MNLMGKWGDCRRWKVLPTQARRRLVWATTAMLLTTCAAQASRDKEKKALTAPAMTPVARIAVAPLGFLPPSPAYLQMRLAWSSLNFIDKDHLLFTFHENRLLHRTPDDTRDDADQMIRADVLDIASGKMQKTAEWRMHDRGRYIWGLRDGQFLVREKNTLYLTNSSLILKPYLGFDTDLQGVEVSPGRTLLMLEIKRVIPATEGNGAGLAPTLLDGGGTKPIEKTRTEMVLLHPGDRNVLAKAMMRIPKSVPLMEDGVVETLSGDNQKQWVLQKQTVNKVAVKMGRVVSDCAPQVQALSSDVILAVGCPPNGANGNTVTAMKGRGDVLWQDRWGSRYIWPVFEYAENGSRFAYESLEANRDIGEMDSFGDADIVAQPVGVFDTDTGKLVLVENADPILSEGQNFALSADGRRFAILRNGAIEVYGLPPVSTAKPVERAKK
jgi:hypothetical protein